MSAAIIPFPAMTLVDAREIVASADRHDDNAVADACQILAARGDWMDHERARELRRMLDLELLARTHRRRAIRETLSDALGLAGLFAALILFLLLTPN